MIGIGIGITWIRGVPFSPASLFANGEQGAWFDPSDSTTLFTDTAGTTQADVGDPVARIDDKSGNGNHATQPTVAARPILQQTTEGLYYLEFDGVDDILVTPTITPGTDKVQVFSGVSRVGGDGVAQYIANQGAAVARSWSLRSQTGAGQVLAHSNGSIIATASLSADVAPVTNVLTALADVTGPLVSLRRNGGVPVTNVVSQGTAGNYAANPIYIGAASTGALVLNGHIYSLITRFGPNLDATTIAKMESHVANKTGVTI